MMILGIIIGILITVFAFFTICWITDGPKLNIKVFLDHEEIADNTVEIKKLYNTLKIYLESEKENNEEKRC